MANQPPYAEYPRPGGGSNPLYGRPPGVYFEAIGEAWNLVKQDLGHWVAATIVYFVAAWGLSLPISLLTQSMLPRNPRPEDMPQFFAILALQMALNIVPTAITTVLLVGMVSMGVKKTRGEYVNVGMIFEPFRRFGAIFGASLLMYLVLGASVLACVLPVFYFMPVLFFMPYVAYLKGTNPIESLSLTFNACKGHWAGLFGLFFVLGLVAGVGVCACFVGILFTFPIYCVAVAIHYRAFFESGSEPVPTTY